MPLLDNNSGEVTGNEGVKDAIFEPHCKKEQIGST